MKNIDVINNLNKEGLIKFLRKISSEVTSCYNCFVYPYCDCVDCEKAWDTFLEADWDCKSLPMKSVEELTKENRKLKEENEALKAQAETYITYYRAKHDDIEGELFKLREENEKLKADKRVLDDETIVVEVTEEQLKNYEFLEQKNFLYKNALNRIKTIASTVQDTCNDCQEQINHSLCNGMCNGYKLIKILEESKNALKEGNNGN